MSFWHWKSTHINQYFKCRYHSFINQVCRLQAGSHLTLTKVSLTTVACQMSCPTEMSALALFYREPHNTLDYVQGWISLSLIHIPHVSSCHILLFSPSLNALAIPVNILWSASCLVSSVPAWKPGLHACLVLETSGRLRTWTSYTTAPSHSRCISFQYRLCIIFEGWQPFSTQNISLVTPSSRSPLVQTDFCTSPVQQ